MSISLAFYLLLAGLMPNMDLHELGKIPDLVSHFMEHREAEDAMGVLEFVAFHYGKQSHTPTDGHTLPFQDHPCCMVFHSFNTEVEPFIFHFTAVYSNQEYIDTYTYPFTSLFAVTIWQPPNSANLGF